MSELGRKDPERITIECDKGRYVILKPDGLERAVWFERDRELVTVEQLRRACDRYSARKTTVPGSYAYRHYVATGHAFGFGCCLGTETV